MPDINNKLTNTTVFILNAFIHITFVFSFLTFLFIYIILPLSTQKLHEELDSIIDSNIDRAIPTQIDVSNINNDPVKRKELISILSSIFQQYYNNQDPNSTLSNSPIFNININDLINKNVFTNELYDNLLNTYNKPNYLITLHNKSIINYSFYISVILLFITVVLIIADKISCTSCINVSKLLIENLFVCIIVGITEYWFFVNFAFKYNPIPPSLLISSSIDNIKKLL